MKIKRVITLSYEADNGATGFFSCAIDTSANAPTPYQQVKASMRNAGFADPPPDDPTFETAINEEYSAEADADRAAVTPAQVTALLERIDARQAQIDQRRAVITADLALLPTATAAQQRQIIGRLLNSEDNTLTAEEQELTALDKLIRAMRRLVR